MDLVVVSHGSLESLAFNKNPRQRLGIVERGQCSAQEMADLMHAPWMPKRSDPNDEGCGNANGFRNAHKVQYELLN